MPHQCTNCGRTFPDGSKEMLSGCPDCGGNKFQFRPAGSLDDGPPPDSASSAVDSSDAADDREPDSSEPATSAPATTEEAADPESAAGDAADPAPIGAVPPDEQAEDRAQADARSEVVTPDELSVAARPKGDEGDRETDDADPDPEDRPALDDLREELNDQFESIKIVNPGQYELNLMELYDREEYIISLREDGRYIIEVPETWRRTGDEDA